MLNGTNCSVFWLRSTLISFDTYAIARTYTLTYAHNPHQHIDKVVETRFSQEEEEEQNHLHICAQCHVYKLGVCTCGCMCTTNKKWNFQTLFIAFLDCFFLSLSLWWNVCFDLNLGAQKGRSRRSKSMENGARFIMTKSIESYNVWMFNY